MALRCDSCLGKKQVIGLGGIMRQCDTCKGVGYVAEKPKAEVKTKIVVKPKSKIKAKPKSKVIKPKEVEVQDAGTESS